MASVDVWDSLVSWLGTFEGGKDAVSKIKLVRTAGGRGLVADGDLPPGTRLITIPETALLNSKTLRPLYPDSFHESLTSTQWISLHLALHYRRHQQPASPSVKPHPRDVFRPFIESIPYEFPTMPLHWSLTSRTGKEIFREFQVDANDKSILSRKVSSATRKQCKTLIELLPNGVRKREEDVERRLKEDWLVAKRVWASHCEADSAEKESFDFYDFALAWKNVNTRCVYYDLGRKKSDNLTLAPVIDMINHQDGMWTKPLQGHSCLSFSSPDARAPEAQYKDGDELAFSYGAHEDSMLLTEYGFILGKTNPYNCVGLDEDIAALFAAQGEEGKLKKRILEDEGYWGDMTLQANPAPASASWRVLIALRLLHLRLPTRYVSLSLSQSEVEMDLHPKVALALEPWRTILTGEDDLISPSNEAKVAASIRMICEQLRIELEAGVELCKSQRKKWEQAEKGARETRGIKEEETGMDMRDSLNSLLGIWEAERWIVEQVVQAL